MKTGRAKSVMPVQCETCIFRDVQHFVSPARLQVIKNYLIAGERHVCHKPSSMRNDVACRGGRNLQLLIWHRMGFIDAPTDDALYAAMESEGVIT